MKSKQLQELKNYSEQEIVSLLDQKEKRLFDLKTQKRVASLKNPLEIKTLRRDIARIKTVFKMKFNRKV